MDMEKIEILKIFFSTKNRVISYTSFRNINALALICFFSSKRRLFRLNSYYLHDKKSKHSHKKDSYAKDNDNLSYIQYKIKSI